MTLIEHGADYDALFTPPLTAIMSSRPTEMLNSRMSRFIKSSCAADTPVRNNTSENSRDAL
jgi:hypothetical protein